jgi:hypothetical protein
MAFSFDSAKTSLYDQDYWQWLEKTAFDLQNRDFAAVDWQNLIEEIQDMGKRERRSAESNLIVILVHLLKWQFQPDCRTGSWGGSIVEHRGRIADILADSPSLDRFLADNLADCYQRARKQAIAETELPSHRFPSPCPYSLAAVLDDDFWPDAAREVQK